MTAALRPYQQESVDAVLDAWRVGHRAPLLVLPTGTGKTAVLARVAEAIRPEGRTLVLAHREELIDQAVTQIGTWTALTTAVEMAERRADQALGGFLAPDVVVASVQSLVRRLDRYDPAAFGLVVIDECHHSPATTYRKILDHFVGAKRLGVTATPDRLDGQALGGLFDVAAKVYELRDAIEDGWLAPIRQVAVRVQAVDLEQVRTVAGDLHEGDLESVLLDPRALHGVAKPTVDLAEDRPTLVFAATVAHAEALGQTLQGYAGDRGVRWVSGRDDRDTRRAVLAEFRRGACQFLVNVQLFTEGFDEPMIACVAMARPTKSRALYAQAVGRGTRLAPGKADLLVLDFKGNAGKHRLVNALDVLDGNEDQAVADRAQLLMNSRPMTALAALDLAEQQLAEEAKQRALEAARRRAQVRAAFEEIDPFTLLGIRPRAGRWGGQPLPDDLREKLRRHKIPTQGLDHGQGAEVWSAVVARTKQGLCTLRQAQVLARKGIDGARLTFAEASALIDRIAANGWQVPADLVVPGRATA